MFKTPEPEYPAIGKTRYSSHFLRLNRLALDWGSRSVGPSWKIMAVNCVSQRQTFAAPALNSYSIGHRDGPRLTQRSAWFSFVAEPRWTFGDPAPTHRMSAFGTKRTF